MLPHSFKSIGWTILIPVNIAGILITITGSQPDWLNSSVFTICSDEVLGDPEFLTLIPVNLTSTLIGSLFIVVGLMVSFSKEKREGEFIMEPRLSSLPWSVWVNYILLLFPFVFIYGIAFFNVMLYNMFTILIIFIFRFNYILYKSAKMVADEK